MPKHKKLAAPEVAYMMGLTPAAQTAEGKDIKYGIKALVGQYTKPYKRDGWLPPGKVSKGARKRHEKEHGTEGVLDLSEVINARR